MYIIDNEKIGAYLKKLITEKKYSSQRQFGRKYLEARGDEPTDENLRKIGNRLSQIMKGKKGVQIDDLPIFSDLLGVSCEEILSAGKVHVQTASHLTNYDVACSDNPDIWKTYLDREDRLFLNSDEYCKTIIDYILEFKNYKFLHYLLQEKIIWLVDNSKRGKLPYGYGAGTNIKRREAVDIDTGLPLQIQYEDQIRTSALALAIENNDIDILDELCARENPGLHNIYLNLTGTDLGQYYNEKLVCAVAEAKEPVLEYFSKEFFVEDLQNRQNKYIFPYLGNVVDCMLQEGRNGSDFLIRAIIQHNRQVFENLSEMINTAYDIDCKFYGADSDETKQNSIRRDVLWYFKLSEKKELVSYFYCTNEKTSEPFVSNIIKIKGKSSDTLLGNLINESNEWYEKVVALKREANE